MALTDKLTAIGDAIRLQSEKTGKLTLDQMPGEIANLQPLNFKVVGGTAAPSNPKENTIWVDTSTAVSEWVYSDHQPDASINGRVWIKSGSGGDPNFDALKGKNWIFLYPRFTKQVVNGVWVDKTAKVYLSGAWKDLWDGTLYDSGNQYDSFTGGWLASSDDTVNYVAFQSDKIQFFNTGGTTMPVAIYTKKKIDVSNFNTLQIEWNLSRDKDVKFGLTNSNTTGNAPSFTASTTVTGTGSKVSTLDISSATGEFYVSVTANCSPIELFKIKLI